MPKLILKFEWDGTTVHKETQGFTGKDCQSVTEFIEKALGARDAKRTYKECYYQKSNDDRKPLLNSDITL